MTDITTTQSTKTKISKKDARKAIYDKLATALAEYKINVKEKRFASNLKKASKLFAGDLLRTMKKVKNKTNTKAVKVKKKVVAAANGTVA
jgi:hypothetical protein